MKVNLKDIKNYNAIDITYKSFEEIKKLINKETGFREVAYSNGVYGVNGVIVQGIKSNKLYKIASRTSALFMIF